VVLDNLPEGFTAVSMDESFFFFDSLVKRVWIFKNSRPVVRITGSHRNLSMFGAISLKGKQLLSALKESSYSEYLKGLTRIHSMNS